MDKLKNGRLKFLKVNSFEIISKKGILKLFCSGCLQRDPSKRISIKEILSIAPQNFEEEIK